MPIERVNHNYSRQELNARLESIEKRLARLETWDILNATMRKINREYHQKLPSLSDFLDSPLRRFLLSYIPLRRSGESRDRIFPRIESALPPSAKAFLAECADQSILCLHPTLFPDGFAPIDSAVPR